MRKFLIRRTSASEPQPIILAGQNRLPNVISWDKTPYSLSVSEQRFMHLSIITIRAANLCYSILKMPFTSLATRGTNNFSSTDQGTAGSSVVFRLAGKFPLQSAGIPEERLSLETTSNTADNHRISQSHIWTMDQSKQPAHPHIGTVFKSPLFEPSGMWLSSAPCLSVADKSGLLLQKWSSRCPWREANRKHACVCV